MYISFSKVAQISEVNQRSIDESLDRGSGGEGGRGWGKGGRDDIKALHPKIFLCSKLCTVKDLLPTESYFVWVPHSSR